VRAKRAGEGVATRPILIAALKRMVLIDGERLAELMIRHGDGVRTDRTVEIKKLDVDYFEPDDA
jgi:restriction endonuclease Mrr